MDENKYKNGDVVIIPGRHNNGNRALQRDTRAMVTGTHTEEGTGRTVYETTMGNYYGEQLKDDEA